MLTIMPGRVVVEKLRGRHGDTPIEISGQLFPDGNAVGIDLRVRAAGVRFDRELFAALPARAQRLWRSLTPQGRGDVDLSFQQGPDGQGGVSRAALETLTVADGAMRLAVSGEVAVDANAETATLAVRGRNIALDGKFQAAMPAPLAPLAGRLRPGGTCDVDLRRLRIARRVVDGNAASRPVESVAWSVDGNTTFRDAVIDLGLGQKTLSGMLSGTASSTSAGLAVDANVNLDSVVVAKHRLTGLRGRLTKRPGNRLMRIGDLSAKTHGGRVAGFAQVRLAEPLEYGISLTVEGVRLDDLFNAGISDEAKRLNVRGLLDGTIQLTASPNRKPALQAAGVLRVSSGKLYKLPVMLGLLHVVYLSLPGETAFTDGYLTYHLRDDVLTFDEIYLRGAALSIVGSGTMARKTEALRVNFLAGPPRKLPRLGSLDELLEGIARELAEIHVRGTLRNPKMRTVPLRSLDAAIKELMRPGRRGG
jgi:hypothetical protein